MTDRLSFIVALHLVSFGCASSQASTTESSSTPTDSTATAETDAAPAAEANTIKVVLQNTCPEPVVLQLGAAAEQRTSLPPGTNVEHNLEPGVPVAIVGKDEQLSQPAMVEAEGGKIEVLPNCRGLRATEKGSQGGDGLDTTAFSAGIEPVKKKARTCAAEQKVQGEISIAMHLVIDGSTGTVKQAELQGPHKDTPLGKCVLDAVKEAKFATFSRPEHEIDYELRLK